MQFSKENFLSRYLKNVSVEGDQGKPNVEFTQDGVLKSAELKIMNLRPGLSKQLVWEEVSEAKQKTSPSFLAIHGIIPFVLARVFRVDQRKESKPNDSKESKLKNISFS